jgi:hypothetical protein
VVFGQLCAEFEPRTRSDFAFVNATTGEILATPGATAAELDATIGFCHRTFREFSPTAILLWWSHAQRWAAERAETIAERLGVVSTRDVKRRRTQRRYG